MATESLNCPNCGAPLRNAGGAATVVCDHCGSVIAIKLAAAPPPSPSPDGPAEGHEIDPHYDYGQAPVRRPERSDLTSVALGPADAAQIIQLLRANQAAEATQFYQSKTGSSLDEAKDAIDAIQAGLRDAPAPGPAAGAEAGVASAAVPAPADLPDVRRRLERGDMAGAIRAYHHATGLSLSEAETAVKHLEWQLHPTRTWDAADEAQLQRQLGPGPGQYSVPAATAGPRLNVPARSRPWGCAIVPVALVALFVCILGGCSAFVQGQTAYACAVEAAKAAMAKGDYLSPPIQTGPLVVVTDMHHGTDEEGDYVGATVLTPVWGARGLGLLYLVFNSTDNLKYNSAGANLLLPGKLVNLLPFKYSRTFGYETGFNYTCGK